MYWRDVGTGLQKASGIALDSAGGKMYWTDFAAGKIQRSNLDGTGVTDLVTTGIYQPVRIALDVPAGKMYWTEAMLADFMISRANLDGSNREYLVTHLQCPSGIALDVAAGPAIPATSPWGLLVMAIAFAIAATLTLRRSAKVTLVRAISRARRHTSVDTVGMMGIVDWETK